MKGRLISVKVPDDVWEKLQAERKGRSINETVVGALRAQWLPQIHLSDVGVFTIQEMESLAEPGVPVIGSIPAERR